MAANCFNMQMLRKYGWTILLIASQFAFGQSPDKPPTLYEYSEGPAYLEQADAGAQILSSNSATLIKDASLRLDRKKHQAVSQLETVTLPLSTPNLTAPAPSGLTISTYVTDVTCNGYCNGFAYVYATGGTGMYTITWPSISYVGDSIGGLCPGVYSVVVTDTAGNIDSAQIVISEPALLTATLVSVWADTGSCDGGMQVTASGGTAPYAFVWSNGATTPQINGLCGNQTYCVTITDVNGCTATLCATPGYSSPITLVAYGTNVSCNGLCDGNIGTYAYGGAPPYTFSFPSLGLTTDSVSGLCPGSYSVVVYDSLGNADSTVILITEPSPVLVTLVSNNSSNNNCNGSLSVAATGGSNGYFYLWSNGATSSSITGLCPGNYCLTVTDYQGCQVTNCYTVLSNNNLAISATSTDALCYGDCNGTITASANGGTPPYTFSFPALSLSGNTATGLCAGYYLVEVYDSLGNADSMSVAVGQPYQLITNPISVIHDTGSCSGSIGINGIGGVAPYQYIWSNGAIGPQITNLCVGTYCVTITDANGCSATQCYSILNNSPLVITVATTDASCYGTCDGNAVISVSGGTGAYNYYWWWGAGQGNSANNLCPGNYYVEVSDSLTTDTVMVTINSTGPMASLQLVQADSGNCNGSIQLTITGGLGPFQVQWSNGVTGGTSQNGLCDGWYSVVVTDSNGCVDTASVALPRVTGSLLYITSSQSPYCAGACNGYAQVQVLSSAGPVSYYWPQVGGATTQYVSNLCAGVYTVVISDSISLDSITLVITDPPSIISNVVVVSTDTGGCSGALNLTATGGIAPYSYLWSNGSITANQTGLCAGTYCVTVTDNNGCTDTTCVYVSGVTSPLVVTTQSYATYCSNSCDGIVYSNVSGGLAPYSYLWSNNTTAASAFNLCSGTYSVTVTDANGVTAVASATVTSPTPLALTITTVNATCVGNDGSATAYVSGGVGGPFSFLWSSGANGSSFSSHTAFGLNPGGYSVLVTDSNGCSTLDSIFISGSSSLNASISATADTICPGDSAVLSAYPSGLNYQYQWSLDGALLSGETYSTLLPTTGGSYSVVISDSNGCSDSATYYITVFNGATVGPISGPTQVQPNNQYVYSVVAQNGYTYIWSVSGGQVVSPGNNLAKIEWGNGPNGLITVTAISPEGCATTVSLVVYIGATSVLDLQSEATNFIAYPNPYQGLTNLKFHLVEAAPVRLEVLDLLGQTVAVLTNETLTQGEHQFTFSAQSHGMAKGFYLARLQIGGTTKVLRLVEN